MVSSNATDIAQYLDSQGIHQVDENLFVGSIPLDNESADYYSPDAAIAIYNSGGIESLNTYQRDRITVAFIARTLPYEYDAGYDSLFKIKEELLGCLPFTINSKDYGPFTMMGDINYLGMDNKNRHKFSMNMACYVENFGESNRLPL